MLFTTPASGEIRPAPPLIMLGGVPGAGKSTTIARARPRLGEIEALDSEDQRGRLVALAPGVPYSVLRPLVHLVHHLAVLVALLRGPNGRAGLIIHDPATRPSRLKIIGRLARARGWRPVLVFIDVDREQALAGQYARGRIVDRDRFEGHWRRWTELRSADGRPASPDWQDALTAWPEHHWSSRDDAAPLLGRLVAVTSSRASL